MDSATCRSFSRLTEGWTPKKATLNQPTGASRLCLSCHDGLLALGNQVVKPSSSGRLEFIDKGQGSGECYLSCQGKDHNPQKYL